MVYDSFISWQMVEAAMSTFVPTSGGFSLAKRGIITLSNGRKVFVKLATEEDSRRFITKEIAAYKWLEQKGYSHIPEVLLTKEDGLVLPDLSQFDWSEQWDEQKLGTVFSAIDELANLEITEADKRVLQETEILNGWQALLDEPKYYKKLLEKLEPYKELQSHLSKDIKLLASQTEAYLHEKAAFQLIHADIRADNLAYDQETHKVYIVDWNWMGLGRKGLEDVALLTNVARNGFDVESYCPERLDPVAAAVLAGFWFYHSTRRIWEGGNPDLRDFQFKNALQVSKWAQLI